MSSIPLQVRLHVKNEAVRKHTTAQLCTEEKKKRRVGLGQGYCRYLVVSHVSRKRAPSDLHFR